MRTRRLALGIVLAVALQGCANVLNVTDRLLTESPSSADPRALSDPRTARDGWKTSRPDVGFDRKRVMGKTQSELVAEDRTICETSVEKIEHTEPGDRVWCRWKEPKGDPANPGNRSRAGLPL